MRSRFALVAMLGLAIALVAGCANTPTTSPSYQAYVDFIGQQQQREDAQLAAIAASAQSCTDARCVEHVATVAALASMGSRGAGATVAPPPRELSGAEKFAQVVGALAPIAATAITGAVQWHQSDTSRDVSIAQYTALDHILTGTVTSMGQVAAGAVPSITVGGDYVPGTQTQVGGDMIGRDRVDNSGLIGDGNRWNSPNDNHAGDCREAGNCSTVPQP